MELDLEARLMGETLVLNRSLDPFLEDYIELNDLNEPIKLRRNQGDDLMPTIEEGEVIEEFRTRDEDLDIGIDDYHLVPSCRVIFDIEPLSLSFDFVFMSKIFKSLSFSLDHLCHLAILCLDQHAQTLHHLESLLTISLDRLDILKEDLVYQSLRKSLSLILELS
ncbi:hypothetical protein Tco_0759337 [Tanacetum coccineum]